MEFESYSFGSLVPFPVLVPPSHWLQSFNTKLFVCKLRPLFQALGPQGKRSTLPLATPALFCKQLWLQQLSLVRRVTVRLTILLGVWVVCFELTWIRDVGTWVGTWSLKQEDKSFLKSWLIQPQHSDKINYFKLCGVRLWGVSTKKNHLTSKQLYF